MHQQKNEIIGLLSELIFTLLYTGLLFLLTLL